MSFHVRRKEREITDLTEMRQVLKTTKYVTVALSRENDPYLVALSHGYDETRNCLYFHCAPEGKKLIYAQSNNRVWG
jgi:nitroimidazol reductase NimA-like FMN-containing flavoprotein (pyridoxamine 5'-phosphate oxidase superfamily)